MNRIEYRQIQDRPCCKLCETRDNSICAAMLLGRWSYRFRLDQSFSRRWSHWTKVSFPRVAMPSFSNRRRHLTRPDGLVCWISFCRQLSNGLQVDVRVGYYTSVYGLGRHPSDTKVLGRHTEVFALLSFVFSTKQWWIDHIDHVSSLDD